MFSGYLLVNIIRSVNAENIFVSKSMYVVKFSASNACTHVYVFGSLSKKSGEV